MRILWVALFALLIEIGWLALWPLSGALSHSTPFTASFLDTHPPAARLFQLTVDIARAVLPGLPDAPLTDALGSPVYLGPAWALTTVLLFLGAAYLSALMLMDRGLGVGRAGVWLVLGAALVFQTTLALLPGLFSQDVFSYIAYGRLAATYGLNPYVWPPSAVPKDAILTWVAPIWRTYASPYGPVWVDVQWLMARIFGGLSVADQAVAYRLLANALLFGNLGLLWRLLGRFTPLDRAQRTTALAALAWNPLVLFEISANAHNDVLMVSFSLLAVLVYARPSGRSIAGVLSGASFTLGALVKYLSGVGLIWVCVASAARAARLNDRLARALMVAIASAAVALLVALPWLELPDSLEPLVAETANVGYVNSLPDGFALAVADGVLSPAGASQTPARDAARAVERLFVLVAFGAYLVWEARRVWLCPDATSVSRASGRACLVYVLLVSTSVQTWYFCLPVALVVGLGWRATLTRVTVAYSVLALPALYLSYYLRESTPLLVNLVYGLMPLLPLVARHLQIRTRPDERESLSFADT